MSDLLRVYFDPAEIGLDGYPYAWHKGEKVSQKLVTNPDRTLVAYETEYGTPIKDLIRERDGHRCLRCWHPYEKGMGQWSPCDEHCLHGGPVRIVDEEGIMIRYWEKFESADLPPDAASHALREIARGRVEANWRILTVHHLNGVKHDCRWWNLVSLCQRCHLTIQLKVRMERPWLHEHSAWFKPFVAAYYANVYLGEELTWEQTQERMEELLALEHRQLQI